MAELEGVPEGALRAFSTRRQALLEHMEAHGTDGFAVSRVAALATRETKEQVDLPRLREEWKARAGEHGLGRQELRALADLRTARPAQLELKELASRLFATDGLTGKQTTFTIPELVRAVAGALRDGATAEEILEIADGLPVSLSLSALSRRPRQVGRHGSRPASSSTSSARRSSSPSPVTPPTHRDRPRRSWPATSWTLRHCRRSSERSCGKPASAPTASRPKGSPSTALLSLPRATQASVRSAIAADAWRTRDSEPRNALLTPRQGSHNSDGAAGDETDPSSKQRSDC